MKYLKANELNLGHWQKIADFANKYKMELLLEGDTQPSPEMWVNVLIEIPHPRTMYTENFVIAAVNALRPDEISIVDDPASGEISAKAFRTVNTKKRYLRLWWD